jgi:hypothetical protein
MFFDSTKTVTPLGSIELLLFGWIPHQLTKPPDWHANPINPIERIDHNLDWPDALKSLSGRDVKPFWELSRFGWLPQWALDARGGDISALKRMNTWTADWVNHNQPYLGINWACGQEAAIRVMNLAMSNIILGNNETPSPSLTWLVETSARRISPTLDYALGQDNNHGSAEACALFIAGTWGRSWNMPDADDMAKCGRRWLQDRALRLIQPDGSPCQYSTNYHRANLETFCVAELWRRRVNEVPFKDDVVKRISDGARWLHHITDSGSGDAPNFGANDGSHFFNFPATPYRDFRPTVSLAARLFDNATAYSDSNFLDARVNLFSLPAATHHWVARRGHSYKDGGFHVLRIASALIVMRDPCFRFRPSQADALHLDLWLDGENLMRDAGSYSYNTEPQWMNYFGGAASHNTVQFDDRDQMPRFSRFLFVNWLKTSMVEPLTENAKSTRFGAGYRDAKGASHHRNVTVVDTHLCVEDKVAGFERKGVLRWRLSPGNWHLFESRAPETIGVVKSFEAKVSFLRKTTNAAGEHTITLQATMPIIRCEIVQGWESRHYLEKIPVPVLEVEFEQPGTLTTEYRWAT